jgi:NitT/TauT family transport system substrate-binding protein
MRNVLLRLVLLLGCLAVASSHAALPKIRLITDWYPQPEHGGFYHALLKGYYREAGLDVEIIPGGPTSYAVPRVVSGRAEFGMSASEELYLARERAIPVIAVGATMQHDPQGIMVHDSSPVKKFEDLEGKTIAVVPGTAWFRYMVSRYQFKQVKERPLNFSVAPFLADSNFITQCFVTSEPFFARKGGAKPRVLLLQNMGYDPYRVFFTTEKYAKENPAIVKAFTAASIRGWADYMKDPAAVHAELPKRNPELDQDKMLFSWQALKDGNFITGDPAKGEAPGMFSDARWQFQFKVMKDVGLLQKVTNYQDVFTTNFLPAQP